MNLNKRMLMQSNDTSSNDTSNATSNATNATNATEVLNATANASANATYQSTFVHGVKWNEWSGEGINCSEVTYEYYLFRQARNEIKRIDALLTKEDQLFELINKAGAKSKDETALQKNDFDTVSAVFSQIYVEVGFGSMRTHVQAAKRVQGDAMAGNKDRVRM
jgi:hypothetical protein